MTICTYTSGLRVLTSGGALPGPFESPVLPGGSAAAPGLDVHGAVHVPGAILTNEGLSSLVEDARAWLTREGAEREVLPCSPTFPEERIGVLERRVLDRDLDVSHLAVAAARAALDRVGTAEREKLVARLRVVLVATVTGTRPVPTVASEVAGAVGAPHEVMAVDVVQGCSGFVAALHQAEALLRMHEPDALAMVVGAEAMSRVVDLTDRTTSPIFGDGAGALVVGANRGDVAPPAAVTSPSGGPRIRIEPAPAEFGPVLRASSSGGRPELLHDEASRLVVRMDGRSVFRDMLRLLPNFVTESLARRGMAVADVGTFAFHQANARLVDGVLRDLGVPAERSLQNIALVGNTTGASLPLLLHRAAHDGRLTAGDDVTLVGFGTGYAAGLTSLQWT